MSRTTLIIAFALTLSIVSIPCFVVAAPVLNFSDINSGPKTGNTDGVGSGAIVTIWGNNLGSSQGSSKVYVGSVEATAIYYWQNATGSLPGGPADLYTYHKMQEIAFAVPAGAVDGANTIKVTVGGVDSNTIPFTVRSGGIKFIKSTGNDSTGNGSWSTPYKTLAEVFASMSKLSAGDIIYSVGVGSTAGIKVGRDSQVAGTASNPISLVVYPNTTVAVSGAADGNSGAGGVVANWYPSSRNNQYVNFSKLTVTASGNCTGSGDNACNALVAFPYNRIVGWNITGPTVYGGYGGAITATGSESNSPKGGYYLGLHIHDYGYRSTTPGLNNYSYSYSDDSDTWTSPPYNGIGNSCSNCTSIDRFQHLYYLSIRADSTNVEGYEIGWNYLVDNPILEGLHVYDMGTSGSNFSTPLLFHHNFMRNQGGSFVDISTPYACTIKIYDNVFVTESSKTYNGMIYRVSGSAIVKYYNNTAYNQRLSSYLQASGGNDYRNNIFVDTLGVAYFTGDAPNAKSNNLFYSTGGASNPSWFSAGSGDLNANPLFTNASSFDFSLTASSPALNAGYNTYSTVTTDFLGAARDTSPSIGAFEISSDGSDTTAPTVTAFTITPTVYNSRTVPIATFTATDAVGVTGYCVNESATAPTAATCSGSGWAASAQTQYVFSTDGAKTLYAWAKDAAGNISTSLNDTVTVDTAAPSISITTSSPQSITTDSLSVTGTASDAVGVSSCKYRIGAAPTASLGTACTGTTSWSCSTSGYSQGANTLYVGCGDAAGNWGSSSIAVNLDSIAPTITNVSSDKANGTYGVGEVIDIDVTFSEAVTSTGLVTVTLETGTIDRTCTFSVTNSTTGTCNYTVQAGDSSSDLTVSSISGTISDQRTNAMTNFTPTTNLAANKAIVIDGVASVLSSLSPSGSQACSSNPISVVESLTTNENATCRAHDTATTWAGMGSGSQMTTTGTTTHRRTVSRACGSNYSPNVICHDNLGNESNMSEWNYSVNGLKKVENVSIQNVNIY